MLLLHSNPIPSQHVYPNNGNRGFCWLTRSQVGGIRVQREPLFPSPIPFQNRNDSIHSANSTFYYSYPSETEMDWCTRKAKIDINRRLCLDLTGSQRVMAAGEDVPWNYLRKIIIFNLMFICSSTTHSMIEVGKSQSILISNSDLWTASISFNSDSPPGCPIHQLRCFNYRSFRCQTYNSIVK